MSNTLIKAATQLSKTFMPAERTQSAAAVQAAQSLIAALEARRLPEFSNAASDAALEALVRGISLTVEADTALRQAHRKFARLLPQTRLPELGWGCDGPDCDPASIPSGGMDNVEPLRAVA